MGDIYIISSQPELETWPTNLGNWKQHFIICMDKIKEKRTSSMISFSVEVNIYPVR